MIYDVGNGIKGGSPAHPMLVGSVVDLGRGGAQRVVVPQSGDERDQKYLFVGQEGPGIVGSSSSGDIHVVDVSDLTNPHEVAHFHRAGAGTHNFWMDEANQILYAAYYNGGVVAIDVSGTLSGDISSRMIDTLSFGAGNTYTWGVQLVRARCTRSTWCQGCGSSTRISEPWMRPWAATTRRSGTAPISGSRTAMPTPARGITSSERGWAAACSRSGR